MTSIFRDCVALIAVNAVLALLLLVALVQDARGRRGRGSRGVSHGGVRVSDSASVEAKRGERSMNLLYTFYVVATLIYALTVQVAEAGQGYKVAILVADYVGLTYLCFFNSWFRNRLIALYIRIQTD
jgi:hypothetical protein